MEVSESEEYKWKEIFVDDIPVGWIQLDQDNKIIRTEIYSDFMTTKYDLDLLMNFCKELENYEWLRKEE